VSRPRRLLGLLSVLAVMGLAAMHGTDAHALAGHALGHASGPAGALLADTSSAPPVGSHAHHSSHVHHASHADHIAGAVPATATLTATATSAPGGPTAPHPHHIAAMCLAVLFGAVAARVAVTGRHRPLLDRLVRPVADAFASHALRTRGAALRPPPRLALCVVRC